MFNQRQKTSNHWTSSGDRALEFLADQLAKNYFNTSLPSDDPAKKHKIAKCVCARRRVGAMERGRNILIVGAGASVAAFGSAECPATNTAINIIREKLFARHGPGPRAFIEMRLDQEQARLASIYGLTSKQNDFETQLAVLSSMYSLSDIRSVLVEIYGDRRWPHINFEIIAHLLKHRFVDAVINFNFDELLDQAITEEIGLAQFDYVISDGDCRNINDLMVGGRLKTPLYIKPHGTVSHPSTLRFTKNDYLQLPEAMRTFMDKIIRGYSTEEEVRPRYRTNIISIGFAMQSVELLQILRAAGAADCNLELFHINNHEFKGKAQEMRDRTEIQDQHFIDVSDDGLSGVLRTVWDKVEHRFKELYRPRGLARHEIVHSLFNSTDGKSHESHRVPRPHPSDQEDVTSADRKRADDIYCTARLCTEVVIALAKGNGRIDLAKAADGRVGEYFERLSGLRKRNGGFSLQDIRHLFGEHRFEMGGYAENLMAARYGWELSDPAKASRDFAAWLYDTLRGALELLGDAELIEQANKSAVRNVELLAKLVGSDIQTISPDFRYRRLLLFRKPNPEDILHTNLGLTIRFVEMVKTLDWDLMLAVSNHGKVMEKYREHADRDKEIPRLSEKWFSVLVAKTTHDQITDRRLAEREFKNRMLGRTEERWFFRGDLSKHDHHMIVFLKRLTQKGSWRVVGGIQFDNASQQRQLNPIVMEANGDSQAEMDLIRLRDCFFGYVDAAVRQEEREDPARHGDALADALPIASTAVTPAGTELARAQARAEVLLENWWYATKARTHR